MKTTYLLQKKQTDGSLVLCTATAEEWKATLRENKVLSADKRRYFIADCIEEGNTIDRIVIEVPLSEYRRWNSRHTVSERNRKLKKQFAHLSLDAKQSDGDELCLADHLASDSNVEETISEKLSMEELRFRLSAWKPWALDLLEAYLCGKRKTCTAELAEKYGVSEQIVRKYKRQFEEFIKKHLDSVSF